MATWQCIGQCGACCHLAPADRPGLASYLSPVELAQYLALVGEDGWCVHFDPGTRRCRIYADRPRFCRVEAAVFQEMYGIRPEALSDFAMACCRQQIAGVYGRRSKLMRRFNEAVQVEAP
ncbi:YkgJ family cysteine cluster protein [Trichothermofontia sp.]